MGDSKLQYLSVYVQKEKVKKQSQDKEVFPKGDKEGVTIHFQTGGGRAMLALAPLLFHLYLSEILCMWYIQRMEKNLE